MVIAAQARSENVRAVLDCTQSLGEEAIVTLPISSDIFA
jgi:hypothetical protein